MQRTVLLCISLVLLGAAISGAVTTRTNREKPLEIPPSILASLPDALERLEQRGINTKGAIVLGVKVWKGPDNPNTGWSFTMDADGKPVWTYEPLNAEEWNNPANWKDWEADAEDE